MRRILPVAGIALLAAVILGVAWFNPVDRSRQVAVMNPDSKTFELTQERASGFARLALKGIRKEYPNKLDHVLNGAPDVQGPRALHPAFYGCFDWHSSVHGH